MFFWNREKIEPCSDLPRKDATPLEALWISGEAVKDLVSIRNVFFALIMQLYKKKYIRFEKLSTGEHNIAFDYDNVDNFNSNYKKMMEDNSCFEDYNFEEELKSMDAVGEFYNLVLKMTESSKELMNELEIGYDELAMLNVIKLVNVEKNGIVTFKNIADTILSKKTRKVDDVYFENLVFVVNKLLTKSMIDKGFLLESELENKKIFDIKNHSEKYVNESKLWKGLKKYLKEAFMDVMQDDNLVLKLYPYYIVFDMDGRIIENIDYEQVYLKPKTVDLLKALTEESLALSALEFEAE